MTNKCKSCTKEKHCKTLKPCGLYQEKSCGNCKFVKKCLFFGETEKPKELSCWRGWY